MNCKNPSCGRELMKVTNFCFYCGQEQSRSLQVAEEEVISALKIGYIISAVDGDVSEDEASYLREVIERLGLQLELSDIEVDKAQLPALAKQIHNRQLQHSIFEILWGIGYADGILTHEEQQIIETIADIFGLSNQEQEQIRKHYTSLESFSELASTFNESGVSGESGGSDFESVIKRYAAISAAAGAVPSPFVSDIILLLPLQYRLVSLISKIQRKDISLTQIKDFLALTYNVLGSKLLVAGLSKLLPACHSQLSSALFYASTWTVGNVAIEWIKSGQTLDSELLKKSVSKLFEQGKAYYSNSEDQIKEEMSEISVKINEISHQFAEGSISEEEFQEKLASLDYEKI